MSASAIIYVANKDIPVLANPELCDDTELETIPQRVFTAVTTQLTTQGQEVPDVMSLAFLNATPYELAPSAFLKAQKDSHHGYMYIAPLTDREGYAVTFSE